MFLLLLVSWGGITDPVLDDEELAADYHARGVVVCPQGVLLDCVSCYNVTPLRHVAQ